MEILFLVFLAEPLISKFFFFISCRFGESCRYLHATQQQQPKSVVFGSGAGTQTGANQHQKPNPFGFGVQNSSQSRAAADFGTKQNQPKVLSVPSSQLIMLDI